MRTRWLLSAPLLVVLLLGTASSACRELDVAGGFTRSAHAAGADAVVEFFGHNFFQITTAKGTKIITDPIAPGMYPTPDISPHVITVGREHPNHNYVEIAKGKPIVLRGLGNYGAEWNKISTTVGDVLIYTVPVYQQQFGNALKGAAFVFDLGTLCIAHLGDLAHKLTDDQIKAFGKVDIARWVYVADTDAEARRDTADGIVRHISHFMSGATAGYLGNVSEKSRVDTLNYDDLLATTLLHGSPETVIAKLRALRDRTGLTSLLLHYPPYYGHEKTMRSLRLFAERVMPEVGVSR